MASKNGPKPKEKMLSPRFSGGLKLLITNPFSEGL
jgi:hypothetical protein